MRASALISVLILATFVCGCDPAGLRRIQLQLRAPNAENTSAIAVDSPDTQEALQILDAVVVRHGFHLAETESGYIRVYSVARPPETVDGRAYTRSIPCRVRLTSTGLLVTFGEFGFLATSPEAASLFVDTRHAF